MGLPSNSVCHTHTVHILSCTFQNYHHQVCLTSRRQYKCSQHFTDLRTAVQLSRFKRNVFGVCLAGLSSAPTYQLHGSTQKMKPYCLCHSLDKVCTPLYENSQHDVLCHIFNYWKPVGETAFQNNRTVLHANTIHSTSMILPYRVRTTQAKCRYHLNFVDYKMRGKNIKPLA